MERDISVLEGQEVDTASREEGHVQGERQIETAFQGGRMEGQ